MDARQGTVMENKTGAAEETMPKKRNHSLLDAKCLSERTAGKCLCLGRLAQFGVTKKVGRLKTGKEAAGSNFWWRRDRELELLLAGVALSPKRA